MSSEESFGEAVGMQAQVAFDVEVVIVRGSHLTEMSGRIRNAWMTAIDWS